MLFENTIFYVIRNNYKNKNKKKIIFDCLTCFSLLKNR